MTYNYIKTIFCKFSATMNL